MGQSWIASPPEVTEEWPGLKSSEVETALQVKAQAREARQINHADDRHATSDSIPTAENGQKSTAWGRFDAQNKISDGSEEAFYPQTISAHLLKTRPQQGEKNVHDDWMFEARGPIAYSIAFVLVLCGLGAASLFWCAVSSSSGSKSGVWPGMGRWNKGDGACGMWHKLDGPNPEEGPMDTSPDSQDDDSENDEAERAASMKGCCGIYSSSNSKCRKVQLKCPCHSSVSETSTELQTTDRADSPSDAAKFRSTTSRMLTPDDARGEKLESSIRELFRIHDLNSNGLLEEKELVQLNAKVAMLHHGKDTDTKPVKAKYKALFLEHLDSQGRPVDFPVFRRYVLRVLDEIDRDEFAQEMIAEQFAEEARSARECFKVPSFTSSSDQTVCSIAESIRASLNHDASVASANLAEAPSMRSFLPVQRGSQPALPVQAHGMEQVVLVPISSLGLSTGGHQIMYNHSLNSHMVKLL